MAVSKSMVTAGNETVLKDLHSVECPLCLDVFEEPFRIFCGHVYVYLFSVAVTDDSAHC